MTDVDDKAIAAAKRLRDRTGKSLSIEVFDYVENPSEGRVTESAVVGSPFTVKALPPVAFALRLVDGDTIRSDDLRLFLVNDSLGFTPKVGDDGGFRPTIDGDKYTAIGLEPKYSGENIVGWWAHLRR